MTPPRTQAAREERLSAAVEFLKIAHPSSVRVADLTRALKCDRKTTMRILASIDAVVTGPDHDRRAKR